MSFPSKADREKCWGSRDVFWKCLDENNGDSDLCKKFREMYESSCPNQWVKHFDRKREYLKFKDRIQEGNRSLNSCNTVVADDDEKGGRRIIGLETLEAHHPTAAGGITLEIVGTSSHHNHNHLSVQHESSTDCNTPAVTRTSPRIFRKFQPPTFT